MKNYKTNKSRKKGIIMELFKPAWKSADEKRAIKAVARVSDQKELAKIAIEAPIENVCVEAVKKIDNQSILFDMITSDLIVNWKVRVTAINQLIDQKLLEQIASSKLEAKIREVAIKKLTNKDVLIEIAKNDNFEELRKEAIKKIEDEAIIGNLALIPDKRLISIKGYSGNVSAVSKWAIDKYINNQKILEKIVLDADNKEVKKIALQKISDETILRSIAFNTMDEYILDNLLHLIDDSKLYDIYKMKENADDKEKIVKHIKNPKILRKIILDKPYNNVLYIAAITLQDQELLEKIIIEKSNEVFKKQRNNRGYEERDIVNILLPELKNIELKNKLAIDFAMNTFDVTVLKKVANYITDVKKRKELLRRESEICNYYDEINRFNYDAY